MPPGSDSARSDVSFQSRSAFRRERGMTESSDDSGVENAREMVSFQEVLQNKAMPSSVAAIKTQGMNLSDDCVLGNVHLDLAKYHEICRFVDDGCYDKAAALFHLRCAADCGVIQAITTLAKMYCGMPHDDLLAEVKL